MTWLDNSINDTLIDPGGLDPLPTIAWTHKCGDCQGWHIILGAKERALSRSCTWYRTKWGVCGGMVKGYWKIIGHGPLDDQERNRLVWKYLEYVARTGDDSAYLFAHSRFRQMRDVRWDLVFRLQQEHDSRKALSLECGAHNNGPLMTAKHLPRDLSKIFNIIPKRNIFGPPHFPGVISHKKCMGPESLTMEGVEYTWHKDIIHHNEIRATVTYKTPVKLDEIKWVNKMAARNLRNKGTGLLLLDALVGAL